MKIISKWKDYYDYMQGVYGQDEKLIFDRRYSDGPYSPMMSTDSMGRPKVNKYAFAICGKLYYVFQYKGQFYYTCDELNELNKLISEEIDMYVYIETGWRATDDDVYIRLTGGTKYHPSKGQIISQEKWDKVANKTSINKTKRQPILMANNHDLDNWTENVCLSDYGFPKWLPAHDAFVEISSFMAWLVDNPPIPDNMTNDEKILSHGFDKKVSFRKRKV